MILSIDTTSEFGSIALVDRASVVEEVLLYSVDGFGHVLYEHFEHLLARHSLTVRQLDCFAAAAGPGSFTGVRVGLTAVKGLAEATGKRVVAVSNLKALALFGSAALRATVLDARRGEVYAAVYNEMLEIVMPEAVLKYEAWAKSLPPGGFELISPDFSTFAAHLDPATARVTAPRALAGAIGRIAWIEFQHGRASDPAEVDANYVRRSDAELFWKG